MLCQRRSTGLFSLLDLDSRFIFTIMSDTLGVDFDFFGIGEFWGCRSQHNDFGLQFRLFYYERASLIGGVSLKAGKSVVTVMTIKTERARDSPIARCAEYILYSPFFCRFDEGFSVNF